MGNLIVSGQQVETPFDTITYFDDKACHLGPRSFRKRGTIEQNRLCAVVLHTTGGIPGGNDMRSQVLIPGAGKGTNAGPFYADLWQRDTTKFGGAHIVIDYDGMIYQCCDLLLEVAYHASLANGTSVGVEVKQNRSNAGLYQVQIDRTVELTNWLTAQLGIQRQIQKLPHKRPVKCLDGKLNRYGVFGHRNLTKRKGPGDPGDFILGALADIGYEQFDFDYDEDVAAWQNRQGELGVTPDGVPGKKTVAALKDAGYKDGLWVQL